MPGAKKGNKEFQKELLFCLKSSSIRIFVDSKLNIHLNLTFSSLLLIEPDVLEYNRKIISLQFPGSIIQLNVPHGCFRTFRILI